MSVTTWTKPVRLAGGTHTTAHRTITIEDGWTRLTEQETRDLLEAAGWNENQGETQ